MEVVHPTSSELVADRDDLLEEALRDDKPPFPIAEEYPIVLSSQSSQYSYCAVRDDRVVAHFNLWPRYLSQNDRCRFPIGLVGNVATRKDLRGQGIMTQLFESLSEIARQQGLEALVLWSDLQSFYQRQGYEAVGKEVRFLFDRLPAGEAKRFTLFDSSRLNNTALETLLAVRHPTRASLERGTEEYRRLLAIPATHLFVREESGEIVAFGIVGKGYDMGGVVHEWGCRSPEEAAALISDIQATFDWPETMLLCPGNLAAAWDDWLSKKAQSREEHHMALVRAKKRQRRAALS